MIRGIIFDCFGVLYTGSLEHLYDITPDSRHRELADLSKSSDFGYVTHEEYLHGVSEMTGKTSQQIQAIMQSDHVRNTELVNYVKFLKNDYKIALLSNVGRGVMESLFSPEEMSEMFDIVVLSCDVGMAKPDTRIYQYTANLLEVSVEECVMIDDLQKNIDGAQEAGMHGLVYTSTKTLTAALELIVR